jgi:hypothetical protein
MGIKYCRINLCVIESNSIGVWLSSVEHTVRDREVEGSNPSAPTNSPRPFKVEGLFFYAGGILLGFGLRGELARSGMRSALYPTYAGMVRGEKRRGAAGDHGYNFLLVIRILIF